MLQAEESDGGAGGERGDGGPVETARVFILAMALIEIFEGEKFFADNEVVADEHAGDGTEKAGIADEPAEDVAAVVGHQFQRLHDDAHSAGAEAGGAETDTTRGENGEIVGGGNDEGG